MIMDGMVCHLKVCRTPQLLCWRWIISIRLGSQLLMPELREKVLRSASCDLSQGGRNGHVTGWLRREGVGWLVRTATHWNAVMMPTC